MRWILISVALCLAGCSGDLGAGLTTGSIGTGGTAGSGGTGTSAGAKVTETLYRIRVPQGPDETIEAIQNKALIELAKQARNAGATHFVVVRTGDTVASADYLGALTKSRPDYEVYVRMLTLPADSALPTGAVSVEEIERFVATAENRHKG